MPHYRVDLTGLDAAGTAVVSRYATQDYIVASGGSVSPHTVNVEGRLRQPGLIRRDMYGQGALVGNGAQVAVGAIVLENADGGADGLRSYGFDGQQFALREIDVTTGVEVSYASRVGFIEQPVFSQEDVVFSVRDAAHIFDIPLLTTKYAGTNALPAGVEGTADDIKGQPKPMCVGTVKNITPVCVNTSRLIYQVDGVRGFVTGYTLAVFDKRAALTAGADYANQADMEATAPTAGQYRVWPAGGMFRLGSAATLVTCDVLNPAGVYGGGTDEIDAVLLELAEYSQAGGITSFYREFTDGNVSVGVYVAQERTVLEVMAEVLASVNGFLTFGFAPGTAVNGATYWASHLTPAASLPYTPELNTIALSERELRSIRQQVPAGAARGLPVWRVNLNYAKNWRVMSPTDLAGVAAADQEYFGREYRTVTVSDSAVKTQWPYATELNVTTLLNDATEATAEANRLLTLFKTQARLFAVTVPQGAIRDGVDGADAFSIKERFQLQSLVTITMARFGFDAGVTLQVIGIQENHEDDSFELLLWG